MLAMLVVGAYFRSGRGEQFTLSRIAAALDKSDIPSQLGLMKQSAESMKRPGACHSEENLIKAFGERVVTLDKKGGGTLHFDNEVGRAI
jgi:hypothetical protein